VSTALVTLTSKLAARLDMGDGEGLMETLKATAFKGQVSDAQMTALMIVANQYGLNPWTKEIYAFPDKNNGIVPVVGVDGWSRIINENAQFDGMDFEQDNESCTCIIYRKDRTRPVRITEYMAECKRGTGPWQSHPKRMLRHKAMIQCARLAFGYVGIYDHDEAERMVDMGAAQEVKHKVIGSSEQVDTTELREKLADSVEKAPDEAALTAVWKSGVGEIRKTGDMDLYNHFKAAVAARKTELTAPVDDGKTIDMPTGETDEFVTAMDAAGEQQ
jgi:phage recombination protein Bet